MKNEILTKKINAGRFEISLFQDYKEIKSFETTDMQLVDDIHEIKDGGNDLMMFKSFDEIVEYILNK